MHIDLCSIVHDPLAVIECRTDRGGAPIVLSTARREQRPLRKGRDQKARSVFRTWRAHSFTSFCRLGTARPPNCTMRRSNSGGANDVKICGAVLLNKPWNAHTKDKLENHLHKLACDWCHHAP